MSIFVCRRVPWGCSFDLLKPPLKPLRSEIAEKFVHSVAFSDFLRSAQEHIREIAPKAIPCQQKDRWRDDMFEHDVSEIALGLEVRDIPLEDGNALLEISQSVSE
ncbi:hypothetical protein [Sphingomonas abietis]|uniref:Uncharacterized protein n=1 Tax=Sphingomonas abietis TaxID=3012344 RepID=A0ABY7NQZ6_9SPHN|nr:hypothetical protein [Sphingomonas abietis]WBO23967.1 hypothetical protein PBT88_07610 [Sphingomonas abietis]